MAKTLRLSESLYNTPHLATADVIESVLTYLDSRNSGEFELSASKKEFTSSSDIEYNSATKTGTLRIEGPLTYKSTILTSLCGMTSYQKLEADFRAFISKGAKKVLMIIDSGGGEAYGCFETASELRELADTNGITLIAYVDGIAASAAFALAAVSHQIIVNPQAEVGSIGVVVKLRNINKGLQQAGIEDTYIYAGKSKIPFSTSGEWSKSFLADVQTKVDILYKDFTQFIAKYRKLSVKDVVATNAKIFSASNALKLKLADASMTRVEFDEYLKTGRKPVMVSKPEPKAASTNTQSKLKPVVDHNKNNKSLNKPSSTPPTRKISPVEKALLDMYKNKENNEYAI